MPIEKIRAMGLPFKSMNINDHCGISKPTTPKRPLSKLSSLI
ncbi:MAG: hypothetical protein OFPI_10360 [Osedax symbiont Rs2]|nr:MAG: hypothetical protein OFPI_10360 [Osedax symbiont Rs2]